MKVSFWVILSLRFGCVWGNIYLEMIRLWCGDMLELKWNISLFRKFFFAVAGRTFLMHSNLIEFMTKFSIIHQLILLKLKQTSTKEGKRKSCYTINKINRSSKQLISPLVLHTRKEIDDNFFFFFSQTNL